MHLRLNDFRPTVRLAAAPGILALLTVRSLAAIVPSVQQSGDTTQSQLSPVEAVRRATVYIEATRPTGNVTSSGFVVSAEGIIATTVHGIAAATAVTVKLQSGEEYPVEGILRADEARDLLLLRIAANDLPTVNLGDSDSARVGQRLLAFGAPLGLEASVTDGLLSGIRMDDGVRRFQISVPVSPGSSGGPVATEDGRVMGIVVGGLTGAGAQNLNFAVPVNYLRGYIGLAAAQTPTPLAEWRWRAEEVASSALPGGVVPPVVNEDLVVDWRVLDGTGLYEEDRGPNGLRVERTVRFQSGTDDNGAAIIEMEMTEYFRQTRNILSERPAADFFRQVVRSTIVVEDRHYFTSNLERIPLSRRFSPHSHTFTVDGDRFTFDTTNVTVQSTRLPAGIIPAEHVRTVVAALPDSLPDKLDLWVVNESGHPSVVTIEFGAVERADIRVPRDGAVCTKDAKTDEVQTNLRWVTYTLGSVTTKMRVLESAPHLGVPEDPKCLVRPDWLPDARR